MESHRDTVMKEPRVEGPRGPSLRIHVRELARALEFQRAVLGVDIVSMDERGAVLRSGEAVWALVVDAASELPVLREIASFVVRRGAGIEIVVEGLDPATVEARARAAGHGVLAPVHAARDGAIETHVVDRDGYVWVARRLA